jgi:hypothetical protein
MKPTTLTHFFPVLTKNEVNLLENKENDVFLVLGRKTGSSCLGKWL